MATEEHRTQARGLVSITGAKLYFIVAGYAVQLALPRLLGSAESFGLYATAMNIISIINNVLIVATLQSVSRFVSESESNAKATLRRGLKLQLGLGIILCAAFAAAAPWLSKSVLLDQRLTPLLVTASTVLLAYALYASLVGYLNGRQRFQDQAKLDMTFSTLRTAGILGGAAVAGTALGAMSGFAIAALGILAIALFKVGTGEQGQAPEWRRWAAFLWPVWIYQLAQNAMLQIDLAALKREVTLLAQSGAYQLNHQAATALASRAVGYYRAAQTFAFIPYQLIISITFVFLPIIAKAASLGDREQLKKGIRTALRLTLIVTLGVAAPIAGAAEGVLRIAYPAEYIAGASTLRLLVLTQVAFSLIVVSATVLKQSQPPILSALIALGSALLILVAIKLALSQDAQAFTALFRAQATTDAGAFLNQHISRYLTAVAAAVAVVMLITLITSATVVRMTGGAWVPFLSLLRVTAAGTASFVVAYLLPHERPIQALLALAAGALAFATVLLLTVEVTKTELKSILTSIKR